MAYHFDPFTHTPGEPADVVGHIRKWSYSTGAGDYWDDTNQVFAAAVSAADRDVAMAEDPSGDGIYYGATSADLTSTYTGHVQETILVLPTREALVSTAHPNPKIFYCRNGIKQSVVESVTPLSPDVVGPSRLWHARHDFMECREVHECTTNDTAVYAMDFERVLNHGREFRDRPAAAISSISSVTDISGNSLTTSGATVAKDQIQVHFTISASDLTADTVYQLRVTVTTTDGDTFGRVGVLKCVS